MIDFCRKEKERPQFHTRCELTGFILPKGDNGGKLGFQRKIYKDSVELNGHLLTPLVIITLEFIKGSQDQLENFPNILKSVWYKFQP